MIEDASMFMSYYYIPKISIGIYIYGATEISNTSNIFFNIEIKNFIATSETNWKYQGKLMYNYGNKDDKKNPPNQNNVVNHK